MLMNFNSPYVSKVNLSLEEQVELGRRMTLEGDQKAQEELVLNCVPVVVTAAKRFSKHISVSYDDLFQEGMVGVMEALEKYDYTRNIKFTTFAYTRITKKLVLWIKQQVRYAAGSGGTQSVNSAIINSAIDTFRSTFGTDPTDTQLAALLSITVEEASRLRRRHANPIPQAYQMDLPYAKTGTINWEQIPAGAGTNAATVVEKAMCREYNKKHLMAALTTLDDLDKDIVLQRYLYDEKKTKLEDLAEQYGVNVSTVMRRERSVLGKILKYFKDNGIQPEF